MKAWPAVLGLILLLCTVPALAQEHFDPVEATGLPYIIVIDEATIDGDQSLQPGDEIAVFDGDLCVGAMVVSEEWPTSFAAWRGDPGMGLPGFTNGNVMAFRAWTPLNGEFAMQTDYSMGNGAFGTPPYTQVSLNANLNAPASFDLLSPAQGASLQESPVTLTWEASTPADPDGSVTYSVFVATDPDQFDTPVASGLVETSYDFDADDDTQYYWTVIATDEEEISTTANQVWHFNVAIPEPPEAPEHTAPDDGATLEATEVLLEWNESTDPDPGDEVTYNVYVSPDPDNLGEPVETGLTETSFEFTGEDDTQYYWLIEAEDTQGNTTPAVDAWSFSIAIPEPPTAPSLVSPEDEALPGTTDVTLTWTASTDPDPDDEVTYDVYVSTDPDDLGDPVATGLTNTEYAFTAQDDESYYWTVDAADTQGHVVPAAEVWSFSVFVEEPPSGFGLILPVDGDVSETLEVDLSWETSTDPDPGDVVQYNVYVSEDPDDLGVPIATTTDTDLTFTGEDDHTYYWSAGAMDTQGHETMADEVRSFSVAVGEAPGDFDLTSPADGSVFDVVTITLTWEESIDPDPEDIVQYDVFVSDDPNNLGEAIATGLEETEYEFTGEDDMTYYWSVDAVDSEGHRTRASQTWSFSITIPEPPNPFTLLSPEDGYVFDDERNFPLAFSWETNGDPDPDDELTYTLELSLDEDFTEPIFGSWEAGANGSYELGADDLPINIYYWRVRVEDTQGNEVLSDDTWALDVTLPVDEMDEASIPGTFAIQSTYPNPFNPSVRIDIAMPQAGHLIVAVHDLLGREVARLVDGPVPQGVQSVMWRAKGPAGMYFVRAMMPGAGSDVRKVTFVK